LGWAEGTELSFEAFAGSIVLREVKTWLRKTKRGVKTPQGVPK
jgi:hypothetical protein